MRKISTIAAATVLATFICSNSCLADHSPAAQLKQLQEAYIANPSRSMWIRMKSEPTDPARRPDYVEKTMDIVKANPKSDVAEDALIWLVAAAPGYYDRSQACTILEKDYFKSAKLAPACWGLLAASVVAPPLAPASEHLLTRLLKDSAYADVRGNALFALAVAHSSQDRELAEKELADVIASYADVHAANTVLNQSAPNLTLGSLAEDALFKFQHLTAGAVAQPIVGQDADGKEIKLSDFRGKVVML